jgi:hypothetical protein
VDIGCKWVILGHSERRNILGEDDEVFITYPICMHIHMPLNYEAAFEIHDYCGVFNITSCSNAVYWEEGCICIEPKC